MYAAISPVAYDSYNPPVVLLMRPALEVVNNVNFDELRKDQKQQTSASERLFLSLIRYITNSLTDVQKSIFQMDVLEAKSLMADLSSYQSIVVDMRKDISTGSLSENGSEVERTMFQLVKCLIAIFDDLQIAADDTPINEQSKGYQKFIGKMVKDIENTTAIHGRKALYDLFKD